MAKSASDQLDDLLKTLAPDKQPHEAYTFLLNILTDVGKLTRCRNQIAQIITKLDEMA